MTQEEIYLLFKDLCARLPYGVICQVDDGAAGLNDGKLIEIDISKELVRFDADYYWDAYIDDVKPYLRPVSSMTEEERKWYKHLIAFSGNPDGAANFVDWLNKKMFAYHTIDGKDMFELGIALKAPEGMYE